jgi:hypothetical protein
LEAEFNVTDTTAGQLADENESVLRHLQKIANIMEKHWPAIQGLRMVMFCPDS